MEISILFWLLSASLLYLLITSVILIRNRIELTELPYDTAENFKSKKISVCIPARNEELNIGSLLKTVLDQKYDNFDVHVLDDQSTDRTPEILQEFKSVHPQKLFTHKGKEKPDDWFGKPWACQQLSEAATGELLLFIDADTKLEPGALSRINNSFQYYGLDMLTVWPRQILGTFWENTVIPLIYYALLTVLPSIYVYRKPRWMPASIYHHLREKFAAANGQCVAFAKNAYLQIEGHKSVKQQVVEDVELAKNIKKAGLTLRMFTGMNTISCRMYRNEKEIFEGLRKNFLAGFSNSLPLFITAAILHIVVFILPFITIIWQIITYNPSLFFLSIASITLIFIQRLVISTWFHWNPLFVFTHPLGVIWFQRLGIIKIVDKITGKTALWKGRAV
ncbi:glycosyltransferase [Rhodohalobacter sp.]|uniref:glycosyltransferase n=1 Tax=Rhodohalobacter sp. TaxID=1974210 RepID=UPI002ACD9158|nr:glycosyltransferase [Rhodohalobacter sp.]MDZ7757591.1 glycosyltransferase [Rhodohalobacter sp.]